MIVVVGMAREARIVAGAGVGVIVSGGETGALADKLERALRGGAEGAISFGVCGGLDPTLRAGDLFVARGVLTGRRRLSADAAWTARLIACLPGAHVADLVGRDAMIASAADKAALYRDTGAGAVDMESHVVARLAHRFGVPFAALRAVSDPSGSALPRAAQAGLKANGEADAGAVLRVLAARPWELPALIRTAREAAAAFAALRDARHLLGPRLGCPYLGQHLFDVG